MRLNQKVNIPFRIDDWVTFLYLEFLFFIPDTVSQQSKFNFKEILTIYVVLAISTYILLLETFLKILKIFNIITNFYYLDSFITFTLMILLKLIIIK
jgi:hypothetical protein